MATARAFTTLENIMDGVRTALEEITKQCGCHFFDTRLCASSAAGGLKMVASGLVPDLTAKAARLAAASAGAKVLKTFSYELTAADACEIAEIAPDIILLSGGIDGGNKDVLLKNAATLAQIPGDFCVIVAGNRAAADEAARLFTADAPLGALEYARQGKRVVICENVMPQFGKLNIQPAKNAIREIFITNIIEAKGLDEVQNFMTAEIIPTPLAVFNAAELLARHMGDLMVFDLGGATTDVYSMANGMPRNANVYVQGLQEPFAKRTVEGDIGMRYSLGAMLDVIDPPIPDISREMMAEWQHICERNPAVLPVGEFAKYKSVDEALAREAIRLSAARHVGFYETTYTPMGETIIQTGKDLTQVKYIIGTGGALISAGHDVLRAAMYNPADLNLLKPQNPHVLLDHDYCLSAAGLLSQNFSEIALRIMKRSLREEID